jgi:hypothetical protein
MVAAGLNRRQAMSKFDDFREAVLGGVVDLAHETLGDAPQQAVDDAHAFLAFAQEQLKQMTSELESGDLSPDEFTELARDLEHLARLVALTGLGILKTKLERFRSGLIDLVVNNARAIFLPA